MSHTDTQSNELAGGSIDGRSDLVDALRELAAIVPAMRAGQLLAAVGELCADLHGRGL